MIDRIQVIDSHTGGEPTRVILSGGPALGGGTVAERLTVFRNRFDHLRSAVVNEPRGSDVLVGALLCEPSDSSCTTGVIFFNNVGFLGMCGHGTIGLIATLAHLGRLAPGEHRIETPVGVVTAALNGDGSVSVRNVESFRKQRDVLVALKDAESSGHSVEIRGDVAYGGNWFLLVRDHGFSLEPERVDDLTRFCLDLRRAVNQQGYPEVDHVELIGPARSPDADSRNFVLCPGGAFDRSPCGTGTSAKLACLAADGRLGEGEEHVVESIIGSRFRGTYVWADRERGLIVPTITGTAHVTAESTLLLDDRDPCSRGIAWR